VLINSLESLGFLSVFKAYHQIVSVPEDNDDRDRRRLDPSMRIVPGTDCAALRYETKSPRPAPGAFAHIAGFSLPVDLEAGSATWAAVRAAAKDVTAGDKLDPK
jgi:hypothetical protein